MANRSWSALVTLLLAGDQDQRFAAILSGLTRQLLAEGVAVEEVELEGPGLVTLRFGDVRLTAAWRKGAAVRSDYADYRRPARHCDPANDEVAVDRLAAHGCRLILSCAPVEGDDATAEQGFRRALGHLVRVESGAIALLPRDRILLTADELGRFLADGATRLGGRSGPRPAEVETAAPDLPAPAPLPAAPVLLLPPPRVEARRIARRRPAAAAPAPDAAEVANDRPDLPALPQGQLRRIRAALYPETLAAATAAAAPPPAAPGETTLAMRLSAAAMDMTLLVVALPVGAAVVTHNLLRGRTDMRVSARMMALTGAVLALAQSDLGSALSAIL